MTALSYLLAQRADELLGDGEWCDYEHVMRELIKKVPPGEAMRRNEHERIKNRPRGVQRARVKPRPVEDLVTSGARSIVRDFLTNPLVFETDRPGKQYSPDPDRRIRQLRRHRALNGDPMRVAMDRLKGENELLHDQVDVLRKKLADLGHGDVAERLAPTVAE